MEIPFDFSKVTIGQMKTFKRLCGREWMSYPWTALSSATPEEHAAIYYVVKAQSEPDFTESELDNVTMQELTALYESLTAALVNPQTGSATSS